MTAIVVVDTNVPLVANGAAAQAGIGCQRACIAELVETQRSRRVAIDDRQLILNEYRQLLSHAGQPGVGDAFFKWLFDNQANPLHCVIVPITPIDGIPPTFSEFPTDPDLVGFDTSDRKFVAVAAASGLEPEILNAADTDWWIHREALERSGIRVRFVCPELMNVAS